MTLGAGARDKLVTIERATVTKDDHGGAVETWASYASEWAAVFHGNASERRQSAQVQASQSATFRILESATTLGITTKDRVTGYLGAVWDIQGVVPTGKGEVDITAIRQA